MAELQGDRVTVFRSVHVIGKDLLGVISLDKGTVAIWDPDRGIVHTYRLQHGFKCIAGGSTYYDNMFALLYGYRVSGSWKGPVYLSDLAGHDTRIGTEEWSLKWCGSAPALITPEYVVLSTAVGYADGSIAVYRVKTVELFEVVHTSNAETAIPKTKTATPTITPSTAKTGIVSTETITETETVTVTETLVHEKTVTTTVSAAGAPTRTDIYAAAALLAIAALAAGLLAGRKG